MSDYARIIGGDAPSSARHGESHARVRSAGASTAERVLSFLLVLAAVLALIAAAVFVLPPLLRITCYKVSGNASMSQGDILSAALIHEKEYFFSLDVERVKAALEAQPRIASAKVEKLFPNGLCIAVVERRPVATALAEVGGRTVAVSLDAQGVAFAEASAAEASAMPVLSGLRFEGFRMGTHLPPAIAGLLASLGEVAASDPGLLSAISEIRFVNSPGSSETSEVLIYPLNQRIPVRAGTTINAQTLRSIILVLDVLGTKGIASSVKEIDFRTGTVVYRTKEGQSD
jgi:cell division septal protein FtsQ